MLFVEDFMLKKNQNEKNTAMKELVLQSSEFTETLFVADFIL